MPVITFGRNEIVKFADHLIVVCLCRWGDRQHAGSVTDTQDTTPCHFPVDIACERCEVVNFPDMCIIIQDALVEVGDAPA